MLISVSAKHFAVGLDAGGTKTVLFAHCDETPTAVERCGPAAHPHRSGLDEAAEILAALVREVIRAYRPITDLSVCAGVAGAGRSNEQELLADRLRGSLMNEADSIRVQVVHDACIALDAAFGSGSGLVLIAGTGSVIFGRTRGGATLRAGGWGHLLGDAGSGYAIGRAGLRAVAAAYDGGRKTALKSSVRDRFEIDSRETLIHRVYGEDLALQDLAPLVIEVAERGDAVASEILTTQVADLAQQVEWLLRQTDTVDSRIALFGGMLQNDHYAQCLRRTLLDRFPEWTIEPLEREPAEGALLRARSLGSS